MQQISVRNITLLAALLIFGSSLFAVAHESAAPALDNVAKLGLPPSLTAPALQSLLQDFVDAAYGKGFYRLGVETDFDHGHVLLDAAGRPIAMLYHTQELSHLDKIPGALDPMARNWIEWLDTHKVEDARLYLRKSYPETATWHWFETQRLPLLEARHTILDKMLDPILLGTSVASSRQWVFTRHSCGRSTELRVQLPTKEEVCLALSSY